MADDQTVDAYIYHREQDVTRSRSLFRTIGCVDERIDGGAGQDETARQETHNCYVVRLGCIRRNDHEYPNDGAQHEGDGKPGIVWEFGVGLGRRYRGADERDKPRKLFMSTLAVASTDRARRIISRRGDPETYHCDRNRGQRKRVS